MKWTEIPGWFQWRSAQEEAVQHFPAGFWFVEVGNYLSRSLCSLATSVVGSRSEAGGSRRVSHHLSVSTISGKKPFNSPVGLAPEFDSRARMRMVCPAFTLRDV